MDGHKLHAFLALLECQHCSADPRRAAVFLVWCGVGRILRGGLRLSTCWPDGATFRRGGAPRATHKLCETSKDHYIVTEVLDKRPDQAHPWSPLPLVIT